ncbi:MAG: antitoxin Xre/MbcA/ParS toxin-binding domain-containing protein, partial [Longimicrobiales bacterium]
EARLWLFSHHPDLGGKRPVDLLAEDRTDEVLTLIDRMQSGAYD